MKKNKKRINTVLIAALVLLSGVGVVYGVGVINERQDFIQASKQSEAIINSIAKEGKLETQRYCQRNDMKYSKGVLSCSVIFKKTTEVSSRSQVTKATEQSKWIFKGNNDIALNDSENTYAIANLYNNGTLNCFVRERILNDQHSELEVGCSGPAKAEWFTVREN